MMGAGGRSGCGMESVCNTLLIVVVFVFRGIGELLARTEHVSFVIMSLKMNPERERERERERENWAD